MWVDPRLAAHSAAPNRGRIVSAAGIRPGGLVNCVCRKAKAQDFVLRISRFHPDACLWQRLVKMALALHWGINL